MMISVLQAKIRYAIITDASPEYKGSITIDEDIMDDLGVVEWQECDVNAMNEDQYGLPPFRGTTYILKGQRGTGCIEANGALAYHLSVGDVVHINVYAMIDAEAGKDHKPIVIESNEDYHK